MNPIEEKIQKLVLMGITELAKNPLVIEHILTFGKVKDEDLLKANAHIVAILKMLHPFFDIAKSFVPANTPIAGDILDWAEKIYPILVK